MLTMNIGSWSKQAASLLSSWAEDMPAESWKRSTGPCAEMCIHNGGGCRGMPQAMESPEAGHDSTRQKEA